MATDEKYPPRNLTSSVDAGMQEAKEPEAPREIHPREVLQKMISQKCEYLIDQIAMLREMKAQVQFMVRAEAEILLRAIRSGGLLR